ncbi:uncharacterized protein si:ch211-196f5.2 [Synchiropus splendidus]|uniref:uncharacterized protein si:ch211-196f5.2 n=1 Tax=Synchiropus splendidus TaxID=270530 RepID=UPI00237DD528|nr:uncharacterized protein si:ch211-196f5.2 [Synchiropus splendidus]
MAADESKSLQDSEEGHNEQGEETEVQRAELDWEIPMLVLLPIQVEADTTHQPFPFLDTTLADLGIQESEVKERVVWVDTKKTQVKNKAGKVKEKETTILEVRVKAQKPGDKNLQEVLYSTEAHTDRSFCRTGVNILPWKQQNPETGLESVKVSVSTEDQPHIIAQEHKDRGI